MVEDGRKQASKGKKSIKEQEESKKEIQVPSNALCSWIVKEETERERRGQR